jgi:hypothetical protein
MMLAQDHVHHDARGDSSGFGAQIKSGREKNQIVETLQ